MERYFLEPYRFIPPFRSTFWCRILGRILPRHMRKKMGVVRWHFEGLEHLRQSLDQRAGILLTPNHCRWTDPMVLGLLGGQVRQYLYYVASYHLFRQNRVMGWVLNRLGGYSIWREGADRESIRVSARILAEAERPVVLFPEGTWFRQNDRVGPLQEGLSLIARQATRHSDRPIVVHPVGIKYWMLEDPRPEVTRRLARVERRLLWQPQTHLELLPRIEKLGAALLAIKEIEYTGAPGSGSLDERIRWLTGSQVERLEREHLGRTHAGWILERIRRLRQHLSRRLLDEKDNRETAARIRKDLADLLFCENLNAHSLEYLREDPSPERLTETVQRIEETVSDEIEVPLVPMGVTVRVGAALDVRHFAQAGRGAADPLVQHLHGAIQQLIDALYRTGPPAEWGCPARPADRTIPSPFDRTPGVAVATASLPLEAPH